MRIEWPTLALILICHLVWTVAVFVVPEVSVAISIFVLVLVIALQSSLQHEVCHGHPFGNRRVAEPLVFASYNLAIPYVRFRDTHLAHHMDSTLTDPYDDPESNYLAPDTWKQLKAYQRWFLLKNNTLLGRMLLGPMIGQWSFMASDWREFRSGRRDIAWAWAGHAVASAAIIFLVLRSPLPLWAYLVACYGGLAVLKIRTFLEHQAHERARGRTVIIEDRGILSFLFLNNNLHVVHHMHPKLPWYRLPGLYFNNRQRYLERNAGYRYESYLEIFRRYAFSSKDPVVHPFYPKD